MSDSTAGEAWPDLGSVSQNPLNNPFLAGSLADSIDELLAQIVASQPTSQPRARGKLMGCDLLDDRMLCWRMEEGHLADRKHIQRVFSFLQARGVLRARNLWRLYGASACNSMALLLESWELEAVQDWSEGLDNPGGWIHSSIRELWRGGY